MEMAKSHTLGSLPEAASVSPPGSTSLTASHLRTPEANASLIAGRADCGKHRRCGVAGWAAGGARVRPVAAQRHGQRFPERLRNQRNFVCEKTRTIKIKQPEGNASAAPCPGCC